MPHVREKKLAKDGSPYYVVKSEQKGSRVREFLMKYFGPAPGEQYQRNTAIKQMQDAVRRFLSPVLGRRK